jgi:LacI family transcriptional regulator
MFNGRGFSIRQVLKMVHDRRRPSLKDVAALAGTSVATASRVINNSGYITEHTRSRVMEAATRLNYQPNLQAKGLKRGASNTIGLLIPNLLNAYYTTLADAISHLLTEQGYQLLLSSTRDDPLIEHETLRTLVGHGVDGLIWVPTASGAGLLDYLKNQQIPVVSIVRGFKNSSLDTIIFEDFEGSYAATKHLLQLGHRQIGYIGGDINFSSNHDRWKGFLTALKDAGIQINNVLIKVGSVNSTWGSLAANELLALPNPPTAFFVASNAFMPGIMKTLRQLDRSVPDQISLICFDDLDWFSYSSPPISAVSTSHDRMAEAAVSLLVRRIREPFDPERQPMAIKISYELVIRNSTSSLFL